MMLRIYFFAQWFTLSDPAVEEGLYDLVAMHRFVGLEIAPEDAFRVYRLEVFHALN